MTMKTCASCGESKPLTMFGWINHSKRRPCHSVYCKACKVQKQAVYEKSLPAERVSADRRKFKLRKKYGLSPEEYDKQFSHQSGQCAICRRSLVGLSPQTVHVDHCHDTGRLRGILCGNCNVAMGNFKENIESMSRAIEYLMSAGVWASEARSANLYVPARAAA